MSNHDPDLIPWLKQKIADELKLIGHYQERLQEIQDKLRQSQEMLTHYETWLNEELEKGGNDEPK